MKTASNNTRRYELVHWLWLWVLAAMAITALVRHASGSPPPLPMLPKGDADAVTPMPIPMPNVDRPDLFRFPTVVAPIAIDDVLDMNRRGQWTDAIDAWDQVPVTDDSEVWKEVGVAVAFLRLNQPESAHHHLNLAMQQETDNAVVHYLLGRVYQAKSRQVPFWYDIDDKNPFRFAVAGSNEVIVPPTREPSERGGVFLPQLRYLQYDKQAHRHFQRAAELAPKFRMDRVIHVIPTPMTMIDSPSAFTGPVTVYQLLDSVGETDFETKIEREIVGVSI